jgi:pyruvate/2-oxoglutarate dehydrogenase complex dihydrolipoamide acyltransferase (E2) component
MKFKPVILYVCALVAGVIVSTSVHAADQPAAPAAPAAEAAKPAAEAAKPAAEAAKPAAEAAKPAAAAEAAKPKSKEGPCYSDLQKFCKDVQPGAGRMFACLNDNASKLAPACGEMVKRANTRLAKLHKACDADVEKFCKDTEQGGGRILTCLKFNEADLSAACKAEFQAGRSATAPAEK